MIDSMDRDVWLSAAGALVALWSVGLVIYAIASSSKREGLPPSVLVTASAPVSRAELQGPHKVKVARSRRLVGLAFAWEALALFFVAAFLLISGQPTRSAMVAVAAATICGVLSHWERVRTLTGPSLVGRVAISVGKSHKGGAGASG